MGMLRCRVCGEAVASLVAGCSKCGAVVQPRRQAPARHSALSILAAAAREMSTR